MTAACIGRDLRNEPDKRITNITTEGSSKEDKERDSNERFQSLQSRDRRVLDSSRHFQKMLRKT